MKKTIELFQKAKQNNDNITMLTAYDYTMAKLLDEAGIDTILVGDSLGMVVLGYEDTLSVTMEDMIHHCAAVARGAKNAFIVCDMPFMSYHVSVEQAVINAGRLMKEGRANAVKLEGGGKFAEHVKAITEASIPVVGHLGLTPQSVNSLGGFKVQGKNEAAARKLLEDAKALEAAGAIAIVFECVPAKITTFIQENINIPIIGIGAGNGCNGQVLVAQDMLSMFGGFKPKFVKSYANIGEQIKEAVSSYISEVKSKDFPAEEHTFKIDDEVVEALYGGEK